MRWDDTDDVDFDFHEPPGWQSPITCPACHGSGVHMVEPRDAGLAIFTCEGCQTRFESEW